MRVVFINNLCLYRKTIRIYYLKQKARLVKVPKTNSNPSCSWTTSKGKGHPTTGHENPEVEQMYSSTLPSTSTLDEGRVVNATPRPLYPLGKRHGTRCIGIWVGPRAGLDGCGNPWSLPGFDPRTVLPIPSRHTD